MKDVTTPKSTKILCLEDNALDRELLETALKSDGLECDFTHTRNRVEFEDALQFGAFDLIISDFSLPAYDGLTALAATRACHPDTPFIFVSGTIGEERAIESLKSGATDYVLKDRRDRLVAAVRRALRESQQHAERRLLEHELRQSQKMEAVGRLAAGVAHDFNNLLAVIQGNAELALLNKEGLDKQTLDNLTQITMASERAANLTRQLLTFGRKHNIQCQTVNLNEAIASLTKMLKRIIGEDIALRCVCPQEPLFVNADVNMLDQVLLNLVVNARDAMPKGGKVSIAIENAPIGKDYVQLHPEGRVGNFICVSVSDTGCGIAPENMGQIFEPFFTTKEVGKGTGMGLATVHGIVKQHQGWINLSSAVGLGTTFKVYLPAISAPAEESPSSESESPSPGGNETILLVEDDISVRLMASQILQKYGYKVIEAVSGRKAIEMWEDQRPAVDLLLTDVVMPDGVNGRELAEKLRKHQPDLKTIFVSGYNSNIMGNGSDYLNWKSNYFLSKPFHAQALIKMIRHCLDAAKLGKQLALECKML